MCLTLYKRIIKYNNQKPNKNMIHKKIYSIIALMLIAVSGVWAQDAVTVNKTADKNEWTFTMPAYDAEVVVEYYDELIDGEDNTTLLTGLNGTTTDIYLDRTLEKEKWYTLCLPFAVDLTADGPLKGVTAKTLSKVEYTSSTVTLTFGEAVTNLAAGRPYIVRLPEGASDIVDPLFEGAYIKNELNDVPVTGGTFKGTYTRVSWDAGTEDVLFLQNNQFFYPLLPAYVNPFRGYIKLSQNVPASAKVVLDFEDGEPTAISDVTTDNGQQTTDGWYTISGVKLDGEPTEKGVYIYNGKKFVIQ